MKNGPKLPDNDKINPEYGRAKSISSLSIKSIKHSNKNSELKSGVVSDGEQSLLDYISNKDTLEGWTKRLDRIADMELKSEDDT